MRSGIRWFADVGNSRAWFQLDQQPVGVLASWHSGRIHVPHLCARRFRGRHNRCRRNLFRPAQIPRGLSTPELIAPLCREWDQAQIVLSAQLWEHIEPAWLAVRCVGYRSIATPTSKLFRILQPRVSVRVSQPWETMNTGTVE